MCIPVQIVGSLDQDSSRRTAEVPFTTRDGRGVGNTPPTYHFYTSGIIPPARKSQPNIRAYSLQAMSWTCAPAIKVFFTSSQCFKHCKLTLAVNGHSNVVRVLPSPGYPDITPKLSPSSRLELLHPSSPSTPGTATTTPPSPSQRESDSVRNSHLNPYSRLVNVIRTIG